MTGPRVAIAHDYLTQLGGAERVVLSMARAFPGAPIYTTLYEPELTFPEFRDLPVKPSPLNRIRTLRQRHRFALPLLPAASSAVHIDADVVLASTSGWAHGFRTNGRLIAYCHSPARWLYLADQYLGEQPGWVRPALRAMHPALLHWDQQAARRPARYLANSTVVRDRIKTAYGRDATIVHPPHSIDASAPRAPIAELNGWGDPGIRHHLLVSRLLPYKNVPEAIAAFRDLPGQRLLVVGRGPLEARLRADLPGNVRILSGISDAQLRWAYAEAAAVIATSFEDFGLTPLEGNAFGVPTLALRAGGYLDTVVDGVNGSFFEQPNAEGIRAAVVTNLEHRWDRDRVRRHADRFSEEAFAAALREEVEQVWRASGG
ncbi:glycosyltransferase family 4 protein [Calidifontibacter sp. DB0510]|uniref:D-inositol 3-phosphate glycosyltransferase n=1 Tax=Metallococcus carri TaxID=1656884 RepID=A0A967E9N1_9MICO|nr:glycosyltransferase [Metallococcus carri]NHN56567.1 glycosyltransferase family 4 protein [Metallococcus carri]NOP38866.1 glycosyltransferase [Calidifontibacter sp. DB2511S]